MTGKRISLWMFYAAMIAVFLRALIPAGYMPDLQTDKAFQLVICTADGPHNVAADDQYNPFAKIPVKAHQSVKHCDFALNAVNTGALAQTFVFVALVMMAAFITSRRAFVLSRGRYYSAASPRAPPVAV